MGRARSKEQGILKENGAEIEHNQKQEKTGEMPWRYNEKESLEKYNVYGAY